MKDCVAIVTGGSRGIGRAIAKELASKGANIVIAFAGNQKAAELTATECQELGGNCIAVKADISCSDQCEQLVKSVIDTYGKIDMLVNSAGITKDGLALRMSDDDFSAVINTNLNGTFYMMRAVMRPMMKKRYGKILNK